MTLTINSEVADLLREVFIGCSDEEIDEKMNIAFGNGWKNIAISNSIKIVNYRFNKEFIKPHHPISKGFNLIRIELNSLTTVQKEFIKVYHILPRHESTGEPFSDEEILELKGSMIESNKFELDKRFAEVVEECNYLNISKDYPNTWMVISILAIISCIYIIVSFFSGNF